MILDSSAIVGIVLREPGFEALVRKMAQASAVGVGAPTLVETGIVLTARLGRDARGLLQGLLREWDAATVAFGEEHWREAVTAYDRFGRAGTRRSSTSATAWPTRSRSSRASRCSARAGTSRRPI